MSAPFKEKFFDRITGLNRIYMLILNPVNDFRDLIL